MAGLPAELIKRLRTVLPTCDCFQSDERLKSLFVDERISSWAGKIRGAQNAEDRVRYLIEDLHAAKHKKFNQSVLVLFLEVVVGDIPEEDERNQQVGDLAIELARVLGCPPPEIALSNVDRASSIFSSQPPPASTQGGGYQTRSSVPPSEQFQAPSTLVATDYQPAWLDVEFLRQGQVAAQAVCRLECKEQKVGTAFLVASDLILATMHSVPSLGDITQSGVRFDAGVSNTGLPLETQWHFLSELVAHSPVDSLDFALLRLAKPANMAPLVLAADRPSVGQSVSLIHHPYGGPVKVNIGRHEVVHCSETRIYYEADTAPGSAGAPVLNDRWEVIAMHRAGLSVSPERPVQNAREGIPIYAIRPAIQAYL